MNDFWGRKSPCEKEIGKIWNDSSGSSSEEKEVRATAEGEGEDGMGIGKSKKKKQTHSARGNDKKRDDTIAVSFSNSFGLASAQPSPREMSVAPKNNKRAKKALIIHKDKQRYRRTAPKKRVGHRQKKTEQDEDTTYNAAADTVEHPLSRHSDTEKSS